MILKQNPTFDNIAWCMLIFATMLFGCKSSKQETSWSILSPDSTIEVSIDTKSGLKYGVKLDGHTIISPSALGLQTDDGIFGAVDFEVASVLRRTVDTTWTNRFGKRNLVRNYFNELSIELTHPERTNTFRIEFRVFDDGVGFRYVITPAKAGDTLTVEKELTQFVFPDNFKCYAGTDSGKFHSAQEWEFRERKLADIKQDSTMGLPLLVEAGDAWVAITEADILNWAGMWVGGLNGTADSTALGLSAKLAPRLDGNGLVKVTTQPGSPWRVLMIGRQPGRLIESDIVINLSSPSRLGDDSWVKPGMMAWDHWWSAGVKMNTATIKEYIQLAADMDWDYQLIDWQWYGDFNVPTADITAVNPTVDMDEVRRFAKEKGIKLWLWMYWTDVERNEAYQRAFKLYEDWGIAGVKIDFMDRDDQEMIDWYEKITKAAADHHLMVNFHGAYKTSGFNRTYPNQITREGILGNEFNGWTKRITPEHKLTLPFTRFLAGPADFTPGGFLNCSPQKFEVGAVGATQVQGTRCGELALFVIYDSPLCCVCDQPKHYHNEPGIDFLKTVPTVWDDTKVFAGEVGKYIAMARRSGDTWFLAGATNSDQRTLEVSLDFLDEGNWNVKVWKDAPDSDVSPKHLTIENLTVSKTDSLKMAMMSGGGYVAYFTRAIDEESP